MEIWDKEKLIREIGVRAYFTFEDVRLILDTLRDVIYDLLEDGGGLNWGGVLKMRVKEISSYEGYDPFTDKRMIVPTMRRVTLTPSKALHGIVRGNKKDKRIEYIDE